MDVFRNRSPIGLGVVLLGVIGVGLGLKARTGNEIDSHASDRPVPSGWSRGAPSQQDQLSQRR
jgi:hypothetical protein